MGKTKFWLYLAPALLLSLFVYWDATENGLTLNWDDDIYLLYNPHVKELSRENITSVFSWGHHHNSNYHPLSTLSWMADYEMGGFAEKIQNKPLPLIAKEGKIFHRNNVFYHLVNVFLVFLFTWLLVRRYDAALLVAALFGVHPMHVESVAWISERKDLLYTLFFMLGLIFYLRYLDVKKNSRYLYLGLCALAYLLSLFSKAAAVVFPLSLFLLDYYRGRRIGWLMLVEKTPLLALSLLFGLKAVDAQVAWGSDVLAPEFSFIERLFIASWTFLVYIAKFFAPLHLSAFHPYPPEGQTLPWYYYMAPLFSIALALFILKVKKLQREALFSLLFFAVTIGLVLQLKPVGRAIMAERYTYLPYVGLGLLLAMAFAKYTDRGAVAYKHRRSIRIVLGLFVLVLAIGARARVPVWQDSHSLFTDVTEKYPGHAFGYKVLGNVAHQYGQKQQAIAYYRQSIERDSTDPESYMNLGVTLNHLGKRQEALALYNKAIEVNPDFPDVYLNRGYWYMQKKDYARALTDFTRMAELAPENPKAWFQIGITAYQMKLYPKAREAFEKTRGIKADYPEIHYFLANIEKREGRPKKAIEQLSRSIELGQRLFASYELRASIYFSQKNYQQAVLDYTQALAQKPGNMQVLTNRGTCYYNLNNKAAACADWQNAAKGGNQRAKQMLSQFCQ